MSMKMRLFATLLLIVFCGCDRAKSVLHPVETPVAVSPEMSQFLTEKTWRVTSIDGRAISESLSRLQTLIANHVSEDINISFFGSVTNPVFRLGADGTWDLSVYYWLRCDRTPEQNGLEPVDPIKNSALVQISLSVSGTYIAGFDTVKQANVLIFTTKKDMRKEIWHSNPYSDPPFTCIPEDYGCEAPTIYPAFTADLDWRIFEDAPLSKIFASPLFSTERDSPVAYTWDMVTFEGTPEEYWNERGWGVSDEIVLDPLVRYEVRLSYHGQTDIVFKRTEERTD